MPLSTRTGMLGAKSNLPIFKYRYAMILGHCFSRTSCARSYCFLRCQEGNRRGKLDINNDSQPQTSIMVKHPHIIISPSNTSIARHIHESTRPSRAPRHRIFSFSQRPVVPWRTRSCPQNFRALSFTSVLHVHGRLFFCWAPPWGDIRQAGRLSTSD